MSKEEFYYGTDRGFYGTYAHELANVLAWRLSGDPYRYGNANLPGNIYHDPDTGAHVETLMFGTTNNY
jgi:hypothetical protein